MIISFTVQRLSEPGANDRQTGTYRYEFDRDEVLVGRDRATDVRLPHPAVSLVHLRLLRKRDKVLVVDNGSRNGTVLDGQRLEPRRGVALQRGSRLMVGPFELVIGSPEAEEPVALTVPADTARLARQMVLEFLGAGSGSTPYLEVQNGPEIGQRLSLPSLGGPLVVGREEGCALRLSDADASRQHLELQNKGEAVEARDFGSKNGWELNDKLVSGVATLTHGDVLRVGNTRLLFQEPAEAALLELEHEDAPSGDGAGEADCDSRQQDHVLGEITSRPADSRERPATKGGGVGNLLLTALAAVTVLGAIAGVVYLLL